jgi:hypothetical protein
MLKTGPGALSLTRRVLTALIWLNLVMGFLIGLLLLASLVAETPVMDALGGKSGTRSRMLVLGMHGIMLIGIASTPLTHLILTQLRTIVMSVGSGDPFVAENARRLQRIAWGVLGLELLHLLVGAISMGVNRAGQPLDLDWSFSFTRWLAVLLLFVLAKVFEQGARMREELEGTV